MYGSDWGDGAAAIGDYVRESGNHYYDGDNQRDGLTAGIRKHEILNTNCTVKLRCGFPRPIPRDERSRAPPGPLRRPPPTRLFPLARQGRFRMARRPWGSAP